MTTPKRLILYTRVSTDKQDASLDTQTTAMRAYCTAYGHQIVGEFTDTWCGKAEEDRKGLLAAYQMLATADVDGLVVYKLDRLGRNTRETLNTLEERFQKPNKSLHMLDIQIDTSTSLGKLFFTIMAAFAELTRDQIIERTVHGLKHRKATGRTYCKKVFGFTGRKKEALVESPEEVATIAKIKAMRAVGRSYGYIADELNMLDIPTPIREQSGKMCKWHKESVRRIFQRSQ